MLLCYNNLLTFVKVSTKEKSDKDNNEETENLGLLEFELVYKNKKKGFVTQEEVECLSTETINWGAIMYPQIAGENIEKYLTI